MKLMTYNIYDGAVNTLTEVIKVVNKESPDFLTLNEANTFLANDSKILHEFAKETNYKYYKIVKCGDGDDYHVAIFSKFKWLETIEIHPMARGGIIAVFETAEGSLAISGFHLTPYGEDERLLEIESIMEAQDSYKYKILMGDVNSLSHLDNYNPDIIKTFNDGQLKKFTKNGNLRFDVTKIIENNEYVDSAYSRGKNNIYTAPTEVLDDPAHNNMRLDYIFVSKNLENSISKYEVVKNDMTNIASDHYPVTINLNVNVCV